MAVLFPNPNVFLSKPNQRSKEERDGRQYKWRLSPVHIADLQAVATGIEETDMGICCKYLIDQRSGLGADYDEFTLDVFEKFCELHEVWKDPTVINWRRRIQRCRRAIGRMYDRNEHKNVAVLFITYGYTDPIVRDLPKSVLDSLGELSSLARYSDVVEVKRQEMARAEGIRRGNYYQPACHRPKPVADEELNANAYRHNMKPDHFAPLVDIILTRDRVKWADKAISSGDALRTMFAPIPERQPDESAEHYKERKENTESKRDNYTIQIKLELIKSLEIASKAYHKQWLSDAG